MANNNGNGNGNGNSKGNHEPIEDMPELDVTSEEKTVQNKGGALYTRTGSRRLANTIMTPPSTVDEALAWTSLNFKNVEEVKKVHAILDMLQWAGEFDCIEADNDVQRYLTFIPGAGGWGRALAAMIESGIIVPSALGVGSRQMDEEVKKAVKKKEDDEKARQNS